MWWRHVYYFDYYSVYIVRETCGGGDEGLRWLRGYECDVGGVARAACHLARGQRRLCKRHEEVQRVARTLQARHVPLPPRRDHSRQVARTPPPLAQ